MQRNGAPANTTAAPDMKLFYACFVALITTSFGFIQDKSVDKNILDYDKPHSTNIHTNYLTENKTSFVGDYQALDQSKLATASAEDNVTVTVIRETAKKEALKDIVIFPIIMLVSYVLLILYFRSKGGYKAVMLKKDPEPDYQSTH